MTETDRQCLDLTADFALFRGHLSGMVAFFPENESHLQGLAGLLDWRFQGAISAQIKSGAISGKSGECVYFPISRAGVTYHLFLAGAGNSNAPGTRSKLPIESFHRLRKNLTSLKKEKIGISRSDAGNASDEFFATHLKGAPLWIVQ